jgi:hypothetical protein
MLQKYILGYFLIDVNPTHCGGFNFCLFVCGNYPDDSQKAWQNWRIDFQKWAAAFLHPPSVTAWSKNGNFDDHHFWESILQKSGVI